MKLSEVLRKVADHEDPGVPWDWKLGLCSGINRNFGYSLETDARRYMQLHPDYSGNLVYPIASDPDHIHGQRMKCNADSPMVAYHLHDEPDMYTGCYGRKRREMALYLSILFAKDGQ